MRRDASGIVQNENFGIIFDTFDDKRNGLLFMSSSLGGLRDSAVTDESQQQHRLEHGLGRENGQIRKGLDRGVRDSVQVAALRGRAGSAFGAFNSGVMVRWKNEIVVSHAGAGVSGQYRDVCGFARRDARRSRGPGQRQEPRDQAVRHLGPAAPTRTRRPSFVNEADGDVGFDVKYGLTKSLTLDLTYNTDFAQVEDDAPAGQPDAVQPVLPRAARFLSRRAGHFRIRRGRR